MRCTIFWPIDVQESGFCYGWVHPSLCVAGVLQSEDEPLAEAALKNYCESSQWRFWKGSCGEDPVILGKCTFDTQKRLRTPTLMFKDVNLRYVFVVFVGGRCVTTTVARDCQRIFYFYHRHSLHSLKFYSLDVIELDPLAPHVSSPHSGSVIAYKRCLAEDLTQPHGRRSGAINETVINQVRENNTLYVGNHSHGGLVQCLSCTA
jgi:phosphatidylinositol N-acetylglucosaminyltransferase subunit Q